MRGTEAKTAETEHRTLRIGIVVPARDEAAFISRTLTAILEERARGGLIDEVVVVDNQSTDETAAIARTFKVEVLSGAGHVSAVRNLGARRIRSPLIAFIDGDCVVASGWSAAVAGLVQEHPTDWERMIFGNSVDVSDPPNWIEDLWFRPQLRPLRKENVNHINSGNMVMSRALFERLGGFDESLASSEDIDLCQRTLVAGGRLLNDPAIRAVHLGYPSTIRDFVRREFWHGKGMLSSAGGVLHNKALALAWATLAAVAVGVLVGFLRPAWLRPFIGLLFGGLAVLAVFLCRPRNPVQILQAILLTALYAFTRAAALAWSGVGRILDHR